MSSSGQQLTGDNEDICRYFGVTTSSLSYESSYFELYGVELNARASLFYFQYDLIGSLAGQSRL